LIKEAFTIRSFDLYCSDKCGEPLNTVYKEKRTIYNTSELKAAVTFDHVAAAYKNNKRMNENYIQSNCVMFDVDNTDTDKPGEWITTDTLRADFPDVEYYTVTSRNHMKEKDGKAPRPKYHVYFPIETITDGGEYTALKKRTKELFTYFDKYAADTARFFFGNANAEVLHFDGNLLLAGYIKSLADIEIPPTVQEADTNPTEPPAEQEPTAAPTLPPPSKQKQTAAPPLPQPDAAAPIHATPTAPGQIPAGSRNSTMSTFAFTMLKKYGDCEKSRREFVEQAKKCAPPLEAKELQVIWERAVQAYLQKIAGRSDYIPPREYAQWGEIQPIDVITPPPFPFAAFPVTLSAFTQSISEYTQTAPEMAGVLVLGALGAVFQKKYNVQSINKNIEQLSIYAVAISPPAERKSEVIRHIISPFIKYQNAHNSDNLADISKSEATRKELKAILFKAESDIDGTEDKRETLINAQFEYDSFKPISPLTLIADDTTTEALITLMVKNGERMFIASGEGGVFSNMKGRYRSGDDMEIYLKGHSGDFISVHRKSREPEILQSPAISLAICVQPYIIVNILLDEENTGKGLTGRIVFAYPAARAGTRKAKSKTPPNNEQYDKTVFYALKKTVAMTETKTIKLSVEADEYAENYFYIPERRIEDGLENAMSWNGKAFGLSIRIAALFHAFQCCEDGKEPADIPISLEVMQNAEKVTECLAVHAEKVFAGEDQRNNDALYLLRRIRRYGQREIAKRKMWRGVQSRFRNIEKLDDILQFLEGRGYLRVESVSTGGRPAEIIKVNPAALGEKPVQ